MTDKPQTQKDMLVTLLDKVLLTDTATSTVIEKTVLFSGYHFLMDKDGENQATITDNSLIFQILA